jgi:hypothetical protein
MTALGVGVSPYPKTGDLPGTRELSIDTSTRFSILDAASPSSLWQNRRLALVGREIGRMRWRIHLHDR